MSSSPDYLEFFVGGSLFVPGCSGLFEVRLCNVLLDDCTLWYYANATKSNVQWPRTVDYSKIASFIGAFRFIYFLLRS